MTILSLKGHVHLIIADGKTVTVQDRITHIDRDAVGKLSVYGQSNGTGKLVSASFEAREVNICSAGYEAGSITGGVNVKNGSLTVGGNVSCGNNALSLTSGTTRINGTAGAASILLGCSSADDSITIHSINDYTPVSIPDGQILTDGSRDYSGGLSYIEVSELADKTLRLKVFGTADFVIPAGAAAIGDNAFEGIAAKSVEIPAGCASIGDCAFKDCTSLTRIRIPKDCTLGQDVFDGCGRVYVFGAAGSPAQEYCGTHDNCTFLEDK